ncbi:SDR family oxidoreductase [Methylophilaceae bacterium]|nr:SDR family oxidoreductase [Methylophilaceae bacterium]
MRRKSKILILGSTGLLGSYLSNNLSDKDYDIYLHGNKKQAIFNFDLTRQEECISLFKNTKPDVIINLVALTDVDRCEIEPNRAYLLNVKILENIVNAIDICRLKPYLVHISSDQVYDSEGLNSELDINLKNYYAFSKYCSELVVKNYDGIVLRTNFFGKSNIRSRLSFTDWICRSLSKKNEITAFDDIFFSPLSMKYLLEIILKCITNRPEGLFNAGSHGGMSKADFIYLFAQKLRFETINIKRVSSKESPLLYAYRPKGMRMDVTKLEHNLSLTLPSLAEEITEVAQEYYD